MPSQREYPWRKVIVVLEQNSRGSTSTWIDVFDRVLGKGIVVEAWSLGVPHGGLIEIVARDTRIVVLSIDTYWRFVDGHPLVVRTGRCSTDVDS